MEYLTHAVQSFEQLKMKKNNFNSKDILLWEISFSDEDVLYTETPPQSWRQSTWHAALVPEKKNNFIELKFVIKRLLLEIQIVI